MFTVDRILLVGGILLLLGIASSKFPARIGLPVLVLFLAVGMLAGSEGVALDAAPGCTLAALLHDRLPGDRPAVGGRVVLGAVALIVRELGENGDIEQVGLAVLADDAASHPQRGGASGSEAGGADAGAATAD